MTLNTLLKDSEMNGAGAAFAGENLVAYLQPYYDAGLDAVLVQDMGVLKILKYFRIFRFMPAHR